jgi:myo-inositol-1(or 4)-monophosphatase
LEAILNESVIGVEMSKAKQRTIWAKSADGVWNIDPIDGTSNFVRGIPYFAISIALIREGRSFLGMVYDPVAKKVFSAEQGRVACLNGSKMMRRNIAKNLSVRWQA